MVLEWKINQDSRDIEEEKTVREKRIGTHCTAAGPLKRNNVSRWDDAAEMCGVNMNLGRWTF